MQFLAKQVLVLKTALPTHTPLSEVGDMTFLCRSSHFVYFIVRFFLESDIWYPNSDYLTL